MIKISIALVKISCVNERLIPLGLACLQAYLKMNSVNVNVFNFRATTYSLPKLASDPLIQLRTPIFIMNHQDFPLLIPIAETILNNSELDLNENVFPDLLSDYASRLFEVPELTKVRFESIISYINSILPQLIIDYNTIGFSVNYLNIPETIIASSLIRRDFPDIQIIWGGPSITQSYDAFKLFLKRKVCDGLINGEGEYPLLEIARETDLNEIKGVMSLTNNREMKYKRGIQLDLDSLPTPDYSNIPLDTYFQIASAYRSRGCTHRCKFCAEWNLFGPRFRVRSIEKVITDIETIIERHHPQYMIFGESLINDDLRYFNSLCDAMIEKKFDMKFGTHFRANISPDLAKKAYLAGFNDAWVGFEAFSEQDLKEMNKGVSVNENLATIENLTGAGLNVIAMLVVGFTNLQEEIKNCSNIINIIKYISQKRYINKKGKEKPLSIQWRPAPMYIVPGSIDYKEKKNNHTWSWKCNNISNGNEKSIMALEQELSEIPYEFERPIPDLKIGELMKKIQDVDRTSGFAIGGLAKHIITYLMESKRKDRKKRKNERIGVIAQRFERKSIKT